MITEYNTVVGIIISKITSRFRKKKQQIGEIFNPFVAWMDHDATNLARENHACVSKRIVATLDKNRFICCNARKTNYRVCESDPAGTGRGEREETARKTFRKTVPEYSRGALNALPAAHFNNLSVGRR